MAFFCVVGSHLGFLAIKNSQRELSRHFLYVVWDDILLQMSYFPESNMSVSFASDVDHLLADSQVVSSHGHPVPIVIGHRPVKPTIRVRSQSACITRVKISPFTMPNIFNANIRGGICGKVDELAVVFEHNCIHIGCITETWLRPSI